MYITLSQGILCQFLQFAIITCKTTIISNHPQAKINLEKCRNAELNMALEEERRKVLSLTTSLERERLEYKEEMEQERATSLYINNQLKMTEVLDFSYLFCRCQHSFSFCYNTTIDLPFWPYRSGSLTIHYTWKLYNTLYNIYIGNV